MRAPPYIAQECFDQHVAEASRLLARGRTPVSGWAAALVEGMNLTPEHAGVVAIAVEQERMTRVCAGTLRRGDVVTSGETVVSVSAGLRTPSGRVEVVLERDGRRRLHVWGARTMIGVRRK